MHKKTIFAGLIFILFLLLPCTSSLNTITDLNKKEFDQIKENNHKTGTLSSTPNLGDILWKLNQKEQNELSSLIDNTPTIETIFNRILQDQHTVNFPETDKLISEHASEIFSQDSDDFFMNTDAWQWYESRLGWIIEAAKKFNDLFNSSLIILNDLTNLQYYIDLLTPDQHDLLDQTIDYFLGIKSWWQAGVLNLRELKLDKITQIVNNIVLIVEGLIVAVQEGVQNLIDGLNENITDFNEWLGTEPWMVPIEFHGTIKGTKDKTVKISWGTLAGEQGNKILSTPSSVHEKQDECKYNNIEIITTQAPMPYFAHLCYVKVELFENDELIKDDIRFSWAFSNASVKLDFFTSGNINKAKSKENMNGEGPVFLSGSLLKLLLRESLINEKILSFANRIISRLL